MKYSFVQKSFASFLNVAFPLVLGAKALSIKKGSLYQNVSVQRRVRGKKQNKTVYSMLSQCSNRNQCVIIHVDRQMAPVCSVLGKTYSNECLLHKEACRKRRRIGLAHTGPCLGKMYTTYRGFHSTLMGNTVPHHLVPRANCTLEELGQFPYRLLDWFLLLSRMGESYAPDAPSQSCLSHAQRKQLAQVRGYSSVV